MIIYFCLSDKYLILFLYRLEFLKMYTIQGNNNKYKKYRTITHLSFNT